MCLIVDILQDSANVLLLFIQVPHNLHDSLDIPPLFPMELFDWLAGQIPVERGIREVTNYETHDVR